MTIAVTHSTVATLPDEPGAEINKAQWNANHSLSGVADIAQGGTGAGDAATARTNLGVPAGSGTSTGTNTGDQTITLTGAVTGSGTGSFATTLTGPYSATTFTTGAVLIGKGTSAIQTDATKLFFDVTNHRLGVGNNAPAYPLDVTGSMRVGTNVFATATGTDSITSNGVSGLNIRTANTVGGGVSADITTWAGNSAGGYGVAGNATFIGGFATGADGTAGGCIFSGGISSGARGIGGSLFFQPGAGGAGGSDGIILFSDSAGNPVLQIGSGANDLLFGTYTAGILAQTGYITIKDNTGTLRRLLVG
jgi:hypothetical protein